MKSPMKCVIYCRVSSREQEETGYSLDAQEKLLREYAQKQSYTIGRAPFKVVESASKWQIRKTLSEMLEYADNHGVNVVLCEKIDRLTRSLKDAAVIDDWVHAKEGREVHFVKEHFVLNTKTKAHDNFVWDMKVAVARFYTNNLSEEVKKGQAEKIRQGWLPTKPPIGYKTIGEKGHKVHVQDPETSPLVKHAFELYATGNYSIMALRDLLYKEGLRSRGGAKISKGRLHEILGDPFYFGSMRWKDIVYTNGLHEPLITKDLFDRVQAVLRGKGTPHYRRHLFQFTKMIKCGVCAGTISAEIQKGHIYYSCKHAKACAQRGMTKEEDIEKSLMGVFRFFETITPVEVEEIKSRLLADHQAEADYKRDTIDRLNGRYQLLQRQLDVLYDDRLSERISVDLWKEKQKAIEEERSGISEQLARVRAEETRYFEIYSNIMDLARRAGEIYAKRTPEQRRQLLSLLFSNLTLKDKTVSFAFTKPIEVMAKRIQEELDLERSFEPAKNASRSVASQGVSAVPSIDFQMEPPEPRNDIRTSKKSPVKPRQRRTTPLSGPLLRG